MQTSAQKIRQAEYHEALDCSKEVTKPDTRRDFELLAAVHDVLNAHHGRGCADLNSFAGSLSHLSNISSVALEIDATVQPASHRALVFSDHHESL